MESILSDLRKKHAAKNVYCGYKKLATSILHSDPNSMHPTGYLG